MLRRVYATKCVFGFAATKIDIG